MRWETIAVCTACVLGLVSAIPLPESEFEAVQRQSAQVPLDVQERLHTLQLDDSALEQVARDKRTIAVLRQLFPGISQLIDRKIANITQYLFRVIGRAVLRAGLGGGGGTTGGGSNRRVSITLPTFPPDTDEDDTEENEVAATTEEGATEASTQTELNPEDENQVIGAESQQSEVRLLPDNGDQDQELAASGGNDAPDPANVEAASDDSAGEESDRNKRLINFSLGGGASGGGSGGGSGNFLFDIIRLVAGSGNTEPSGDGAGAGAGAERDDGYQAGIPGPITRLFVIANRGIANLIQDLILRIAQTSERIVNYKARLITAII